MGFRIARRRASGDSVRRTAASSVLVPALRRARSRAAYRQITETGPRHSCPRAWRAPVRCSALSVRALHHRPMLLVRIDRGGSSLTEWQQFWLTLAEDLPANVAG